MAGHASAGRSHCRNCGAPLTGPYCAACGQHDVDYHRSLWPILEDSLEGFLHVDGKFFRTVRWLFTRPGFLTTEFISGRRVAYTQPLRLYIFASFLYFGSSLVFKPALPQVTIRPAKAAAAEVPKGRAQPAPEADAELPAGMPEALKATFRALQHEDGKELSREMEHLVPTMIFFCMPLLATALLLVYAHSGRVYVEHLIFALHVQAFYFLAALAAKAGDSVLRLVSPSLAGLASIAIFLGGTWLVYRAFRVVYGQGPWKTILKMALVGLAYGIILIAGLAVSAVAAALLLLRASP